MILSSSTKATRNSPLVKLDERRSKYMLFVNMTKTIKFHNLKIKNSLKRDRKFEKLIAVGSLS